MAAPGDILDGRYRLGPEIGRGGMADVYRARDLVTGDDVAVKVLRASDPVADRWLGREQAALGRLDHPALVRLRATGSADGRPYLVLDLVDGRPLSDLLREGPLGAGRAAELGAHVAAGLAHAHAAGVTHRDVKPANILIDAAGRPRLADFGIARLSEVTTATAAGVVLGTAAYLAPEQVRAEPVGPPADIYALGVVLIECITGERCFPGSFPEAAMAHLARPRRYRTACRRACDGPSSTPPPSTPPGARRRRAWPPPSPAPPRRSPTGAGADPGAARRPGAAPAPPARRGRGCRRGQRGGHHGRPRRHARDRGIDATRDADDHGAHRRPAVGRRRPADDRLAPTTTPTTRPPPRRRRRRRPPRRSTGKSRG